MNTARRAWTLRVALVAWALLVCFLTLRSAPSQAERVRETPWSCLACGDTGVADFFLNVLLFLPLGAAARRLGLRLSRTLPWLLAFTAGIEIAQGVLLVGRDGALGDVVANTLGGAFGWLAIDGFVAALRPTRAQAHRIVPLMLALSATLWWVTGRGLETALQGPAPWVGQPLRLWPGTEPFPGTLGGATLNGMAISNDALPGRPERSDSFDLVLMVTRRRLDAPRRASLVRVVDGARRSQIGVQQEREALALTARARVTAWRLHAPRWIFSDAMRIPIDTPWRFEWRRLPDRIELLSGPAAGTETRRTSRRLSVALGWVFIHPFVMSVDDTAWRWTSAWLLCWFGLTGWCAGRIGRTASIGYGLAMTGSFLLAQWGFGFSPEWGEVAVGIVGFGAAAWLADRGLRAHGMSGKAP